MSGDPHASGGKLVGVGMHLSRRCARHAGTLACEEMLRSEQALGMHRCARLAVPTHATGTLCP